MNKMAKGALATGVGIILLVGGCGTLATSDQTSNASMGSVVAGELMVAKLVMTGAGVDSTFGMHIEVSPATLSDAENMAVLASDELKPANSGRTATDGSFHFDDVGYDLVQQDPG